MVVVVVVVVAAAAAAAAVAVAVAVVAVVVVQNSEIYNSAGTPSQTRYFCLACCSVSAALGT